MQTYYILLCAMAAMGVLVFICLFFLKAGYGYLSNEHWGPMISNKPAWVIMEAPSFLFLLFYTLKYASECTEAANCNTVLYVIAGFFLLHYFQRSFIFPMLLRGKSKMPIAIVAMGMVFNTINSWFIGTWLYEVAPSGYYTVEWLWSPQFIIGTVIFAAGMFINIQSDHIIRHLRQPGDTRHYIPTKGMYKYVTSANYFGEITEWIGFAILSWSPCGLLFAFWTFCNLGPRSKSLTEKYVAEFGEEYTSLHKKNLIPFIW
ncbi:MAG: DUF1295 domain-containing protein [Bacteroidales bacterium]|nr:DUF1295 domain-containing protein [Bacteroidales bacterium]